MCIYVCCSLTVETADYLIKNYLPDNKSTTDPANPNTPPYTSSTTTSHLHPLSVVHQDMELVYNNNFDIMEKYL